MKHPHTAKRAGFTLIELAIVMSLIAILTGFTTINLLRSQTVATSSSAINTLAADIKEQQIKAMTQDSDDQSGATPAKPHGIYLQNNKYTLFRGASFNPTEPNNFIVNLETGLTLSSTFPPAGPTGELVFAQRSGEVTGYGAGSDTITLTNTQTGEQKTITINRYGTISIN